MDNAEHKSASLYAIAVLALLPGMAFPCRWLDGKYGQLRISQVLLVGPGSHGDDHDAQMVSTRLGTLVDARTPRVPSCVKACLEAGETDAGLVGLTDA